MTEKRKPDWTVRHLRGDNPAWTGWFWGRVERDDPMTLHDPHGPFDTAAAAGLHMVRSWVEDDARGDAPDGR